MAQSQLKRLAPIILDYGSAQKAGQERFIKHLRKQMRESINLSGLKEGDIKRSVYVVRLKGSFVIAYPNANSPVLYIGRGDAPQRLGSHLKNWLFHVHKFGHETTVEIVILLPLRQGRADYFKYVEGYLLRKHEERSGSIPLFNSRRETKYGADIRYSQNHQKELRALVGVGSGKRPWWALLPTPASPFYNLFMTGWA